MSEPIERNLVEVKYLTALEVCARLGLQWDRWFQTYDELYGMLQAQGFAWRPSLRDWSYEPQQSGHIEAMLREIARQIEEGK